MLRREFLVQLRIGGYLVVATLLRMVGDLWWLRYQASRLGYELPDAFEISPFEIHEAPEVEYAATWTVAPATARRRLQTEFEFEEFLWSQLQAYGRSGEVVFERGNLVYWPDGMTGKWQLHVRLFPTADGYTEIWAHWELNIFTHRHAHSEGEALDPAEGERRIRERIDSDELIRPGDSSKTGPPP